MSNHLRDGKGRFAAGNRRHDLPLMLRFLVTDTGCWDWLGNIDGKHGYGRCKEPGTGRTIMAHRFMYEYYVGPIPEGLELDHLCRNRSCVNPEHLEPVTRAENVRRGSAAKLNEEDVREIRRVVDDLCERFGITPSLIRQIAERETWKGIEN